MNVIPHEDIPLLDVGDLVRVKFMGGEVILRLREVTASHNLPTTAIMTDLSADFGVMK